MDAILEGETNLVLEDGDSLHIPKQQQSILVIGEVFVPNSHLFDEQKNIINYIELSGGTNDYADLDNIYTIKANGRIFMIKNQPCYW